jgi:hypothetical protein
MVSLVLYPVRQQVEPQKTDTQIMETQALWRCLHGVHERA